MEKAKENFLNTMIDRLIEADQADETIRLILNDLMDNVKQQLVIEIEQGMKVTDHFYLFDHDLTGEFLQSFDETGILAEIYNNFNLDEDLFGLYEFVSFFIDELLTLSGDTWYVSSDIDGVFCLSYDSIDR